MGTEFQDIDIVLTWVDGNDPAWLKERARFQTNVTDVSSERFRDWNTLQYIFRSIEKNAPWVRKIHFVTWGHLPAWLNTTHPKLHIVKHSDFMPANYLPTFNSNAVELNFHRIEGLSENFIYLNDDIFFLRPLKPTYFFKNGHPRDMLALQPVVANNHSPLMPYIFLNNAMVLSRHFDKRKNMIHHPYNYFKPSYPIKYFIYNMLELAFPLYTGFYTVHGVAPLCLRTYKKLWALEYDELDHTSSTRFRSATDVNQYVLREWQKLSGDFSPVNAHHGFKYFEIGGQTHRLMNTIRSKKVSILCINDTSNSIESRDISQELHDSFECIFPEKSSYEI
jgi:hypothetical protein